MASDKKAGAKNKKISKPPTKSKTTLQISASEQRALENEVDLQPIDGSPAPTVRESVSTSDRLEWPRISTDLTRVESKLSAEEVARQVFKDKLQIQGPQCLNLAPLPAIRTLGLRRDPNCLNVVRRSNAEAILVQTLGFKADQVCRSCSKGHGPFSECVYLPGSMCNSCTNCWFNASGARCTFQEGEHRLPHGNPNLPALAAYRSPAAVSSPREQGSAGANPMSMASVLDDAASPRARPQVLKSNLPPREELRMAAQQQNALQTAQRQRLAQDNCGINNVPRTVSPLPTGYPSPGEYGPRPRQDYYLRQSGGSFNSSTSEQSPGDSSFASQGTDLSFSSMSSVPVPSSSIPRYYHQPFYGIQSTVPSAGYLPSMGPAPPANMSPNVMLTPPPRLNMPAKAFELPTVGQMLDLHSKSELSVMDIPRIVSDLLRSAHRVQGIPVDEDLLGSVLNKIDYAVIATDGYAKTISGRLRPASSTASEDSVAGSFVQDVRELPGFQNAAPAAPTPEIEGQSEDQETDSSRQEAS